MSDDEKITTEKLPTKMNSVQMKIMFKTPGENKGIDDDDAPIEEI